MQPMINRSVSCQLWSVITNPASILIDMKCKNSINLEHDFHISLHQTTYRKESVYASFGYQNPLNTSRLNRLLLRVKSEFYMLTVHASVNGSILKIRQDLNEKRPPSEKDYAINFMGFQRYYLMETSTS